MERLRALVYGSLLLLSVGWLLHVGQDVLVPAVLGAVIVYVVVGLAEVLGRVPAVGRRLPVRLRYACSLLAIGLAFVLLAYLVMDNKDRALALAPQYQASLLAAIQRIAVFLGIESEPTWTTLRQDLLATVNLQRLLGSMVASATSIVATLVVVFLYAAFLLAERRIFDTKLANVSDDPSRVARIRAVVRTLNERIGTYLALKTLIGAFLALVSWAIMAAFGLEFALLWAVLIGFLNFVPYVGSVLGVLLPALMAVVQFDDVGAILTLVIALTLAQFLIGSFLDPWLMARSLNLSPFAILLSLAVWAQLWGIPGAFLAVPLTAILTIVLSEFPGTRPLAVLLSKNGRV